MRSLVPASLICLLLISTQGRGRAEQPLLGKPDKLIVEDDFPRPEMAPKFRIGKGFWTIKEGIVTAAENPADKHGAYAYVSPNIDYKDIVAEYSFKLDGSKSCDLKMEDSNYKGAHAGHIIRASITPTQVVLGDSKFGSMKNEIYEKLNSPQTTPEEKKQIQASIKDKSAAFKISLDLTQWHQARVEVVGDEMIISIDGKPAGYLKSEGVNHPTKNMIGFTIGGQSTQIDNLKVWSATTAPNWSSKRPELLKALGKVP